jgi:hypothetical protein
MKMKEEDKFIKNPLLEKKVTVFPVTRDGDWPPKGKDGSSGMNTGAFHNFRGVPYDISNRRSVDPLTDEEKRFFYSKESGLDISEGELSVHKKKNYWTSFAVKLTKDPYTINLSDPLDYLRWKFLVAQKNTVAPSWDKKKDKATYKFGIRDYEQEDQVTSKKIKKEKEVNRYFYKIENNPTKLRALLSMYYYTTNSSKRVATNASVSSLSADLYRVIESDINAIFDIITDKTFDTKLLIYRGLSNGVIERPSTFEYQITGREEKLNLTDMVGFLELKKNNEARLQLEAQIDNQEK